MKPGSCPLKNEARSASTTGLGICIAIFNFNPTWIIQDEDDDDEDGTCSRPPEVPTIWRSAGSMIRKGSYCPITKQVGFLSCPLEVEDEILDCRAFSTNSQMTARDFFVVFERTSGFYAQLLL